MTQRSILLFLLIIIGLVGLAFWPAQGQVLQAGRPAPDISGERWINSQPLTISGLRGRVVLVEFWTYG